MLKTCKTCKEEKESSDFYKTDNTKDKLRSSCKSCIDNQNKKWRDSNPSRMKAIQDRANSQPWRKDVYLRYRRKNREGMILNAARARAKEQSLPFNLEFSDIHLPETCPVFGIVLDYSSNRSCDNSPSLDKIIPSLGYVKGNVQVISNLANRMKSNATKEQLIQFANWVLST